MNLTVLLKAGGTVLAAAAALTALLTAPDEARRMMGVAVNPFGWRHVVVMHVATSLPLSWVLAHVLTLRFPQWVSRRACVFWSALGLAVAWWTAARGEGLGHALDAGQAGYLARFFIRTGWCVALQLPWCLAATAAAPRSGWPRWNAIPFRHAALLAPVVAMLVPIGYLDRLIERQTLLARTHCGNRHLEKAHNVIVRLCDLGSNRNLWEVDVLGDGAIHKYPPRAALDLLKNDMARMRRNLREKSELSSAARPPGTPGRTSLPPIARIELAENLVSLGKLDQAKTVVEPLAEFDARAAVVRAQIDQQQRDWHGANAWFRKALELVQPGRYDPLIDAETRVAIQVYTYNVLAHNARELDRYDAGARVYFEAMDRLPSHKAYYHHQLGRHYELWGRPLEAAGHFAAAHELDPRQYGPPESILMKVLASGTPVGLFRPDASNYE